MDISYKNTIHIIIDVNSKFTEALFAEMNIQGQLS